MKPAPESARRMSRAVESYDRARRRVRVRNRIYRLAYNAGGIALAVAMFYAATN